MSGRGRYGGGRGAGDARPSVPARGAGGGRGHYGGPAPRQSVGGRPSVQPQRPVQRYNNTRMNPYPQPQLQQAAPQQQGGKGFKGHGAQQPQQQHQQQQQQPHVVGASTDYSFSLKVRSLVDHRIRTPHRRSIHPQLLRVIAHWVTLPVHTVPVLSQHVEIEKKKDLEHAQVAAASSSPDPDVDVINARVLICPGLTPLASPTDKKPILSRLSLFAGKRANGAIEAYGGLIKAGESSEEVPQKLVEMVKEQSGLDLSFVTTWYKFLELNYADSPVPTVFYLPAIWEVSSDLVMTSLVREEEVEKTEVIQPVIDKEGMTDEEYAKAQAEAKPESKIIKEMKKVLMTVPISLTFAELQNAEVNKGMAKEVLEFYAAADAIDEFLKREMAARIHLKLNERTEKAKERLEQFAKEQALVTERKRKREEKENERKTRKQARLTELAAQWEVEDQGKTDDEKREDATERNALKQKILNEKESDDEEEPAPAPQAAEAKKGKFRTVAIVDQACMDAFEYFDRPASMATKVSGFINRSRLESLLLLADDQLCLDAVEKIIHATGRAGLSISYRPLATEYKQEEIPEEPKKEESKEEKSEATEEMKTEEDEAAEPTETPAEEKAEDAEDAEADIEVDADEPPTVEE